MYYVFEYKFHFSTLNTLPTDIISPINLLFSGSNRVTDLGLGSITSLPKLEKLLIQELDKITDKFFGCMPKLKILCCFYCKRMKNAGFLTLMKSAENLQHLEVNNCEKVHNNILINDALNAMKSCTSNKVILKLYIVTEKSETVRVLPNLHIITETMNERSRYYLKFRQDFGFYEDYDRISEVDLNYALKHCATII